MSKPGKKEIMPAALTVAGTDSGGNAGVMADLRTFRDFSVHGTAAVAALTAQNTKKVSAVMPVNPSFIKAQLEAVMEDYTIRAAKTGMLFNTSAIRIVAEVLASAKFPVVVDPVMVATSGAVLLKNSAIKTFEDCLLPVAYLATPNIPEAEILAGMEIKSMEDAAKAAETIAHRFGLAVLVKGGHANENGIAADAKSKRRLAVDILYHEGAFHFIGAPEIANPASTHGTGCTLSAAIAACLAKGMSLKDAVQNAKDYVTRAIRDSYFAGPSAGVLG